MSTTSRDCFAHVLGRRYGSTQMSVLFSPSARFGTWRRLWLALAQAQRELGLIQVSESAIQQMKDNLVCINYEDAEAFEKEMRHDVMSHIHAYALQCPAAKKVIHLGATSCFVTDNADLINLREAMRLIRIKCVRLMAVMSDQASKYKALATLGYTHYQAAQLTTVGKRICLWLHDFVMDFEDIDRVTQRLPFRGVKGTTGSQASFLELFGGDHAKVKALDEMIASRMGFQHHLSVCGQTYSRKLDYQLLSVLSGVAQSAHKMATDLRLLSNLKEVEEPFAESQIGSSAMPWKNNPMRSERVCSLARYVISLTPNTANTHATQWFERTLDDSANRRMCLPEAFLATDAILDVCRNIISGLRIWPQVIEKNLRNELPFMASENILMSSVKAGGDRQELHEALRKHSQAAGRRMKEEGVSNDLLSRVAADPLFSAVSNKLEELLDPQMFIGRSVEHVDDFLTNDVEPILQRFQSDIESMETIKLNV